jgi:uncharacterized protein YbbC (DUF1343 family)
VRSRSAISRRRWIAGLVICAALQLAQTGGLHYVPAGPQPKAAAAPSPPAAAAVPRVRPGVDVLLADTRILKGKRIGLVTHPAGVTSDGRPTAAALAGAPGLQITALFAPEHGIDGTYDAGQPVPTIAGRTPIYSLYGGTFRPTHQMLSRVDVLVVDLQDVGIRPYTYTSTMAYVMAASAQARKPVVVLDRPNPMGGLVVDGPVLEPEFRSFVGMHPIPYAFGLTIGELAGLYNKAFKIGADLTVVPMEGWAREMTWEDTALPWVNPSPGITSPDLPFYYAATGALEGTNLWNGVATESRFRVVLATWIDGPGLAAQLNQRGLPGVRFTPSAIPHPRTGEVRYGVRLHVTDPARFRPSATIVHVLAEIRALYGDRLEFRRPRKGSYVFDLVWGTKSVRLAISRGEPASAISARWQPGLRRFERLREAYLLYR